MIKISKAAARLDFTTFCRIPNAQSLVIIGLCNVYKKSRIWILLCLSLFSLIFSWRPNSLPVPAAMAIERINLPGFGLPVNYQPDKRFPNAVLDWSGTILTVRELNMMAIMDRITDKPDWDKKVFDDTILQKWRQEALATEGMDVSEKMLDWVCTTVFERLLSTKKCNASSFAAFLAKERAIIIDYTYLNLRCIIFFDFSFISCLHLSCLHLLSTIRSLPLLRATEWPNRWMEGHFQITSMASYCTFTTEFDPSSLID